MEIYNISKILSLLSCARGSCACVSDRNARPRKEIFIFFLSFFQFFFFFWFSRPAGARWRGNRVRGPANCYTVSFEPHKRRHPLWDADAPPPVLKTFSAGPPNVRLWETRRADAPPPPVLYYYILYYIVSRIMYVCDFFWFFFSFFLDSKKKKKKCLTYFVSQYNGVHVWRIERVV